MPTGKVKWFNRNKGYGFIINDENEREIFFHYKNIGDPMLRNTISDGQKVNFGIIKTEKGENAINIKLIL